MKVFGISFDSVEKNRAFADKYDFEFPLLSDPDRKVGLAFGACVDATDGYASRYTFVISADGKIEQAIDTKDPGGQAQAILDALA